jgi:hypothetical protein
MGKSCHRQDQKAAGSPRSFIQGRHRARLTGKPRRSAAVHVPRPVSAPDPVRATAAGARPYPAKPIMQRLPHNREHQHERAKPGASQPNATRLDRYDNLFTVNILNITLFPWNPNRTRATPHDAPVQSVRSDERAKAADWPPSLSSIRLSLSLRAERSNLGPVGTSMSPPRVVALFAAKARQRTEYAITDA